MIATFFSNLSKQADNSAKQTQRTARLMDEIWSKIPAGLPADEALWVADRSIAILATPTDAEFEAQVGWPLHLSLAVGLAALIGYALIGYALLAWVGVVAFTVGLAIFVLYLLATEPDE